MDKLALKKPHIKFKNTYLEGIKQLNNEGALKSKLDEQYIANNFSKYIQDIKNFEIGKNIPEGFSPQTELWFIKNDIKYIGTLKIRHRLGNEYLRTVGGHIGIYIVPSERGKGYGCTILEAAFPIAKKLGLQKALMTVREDNIFSQKMIEKCGGIFEGKIYNPETGYMKRYWKNL